MVKRILILVDDPVYDRLKSIKGDKTWEDLFLGSVLKKDKR